MLDKDRTFTARCDFCAHEDFDTEETDFLSAVEAMKKKGWKVFKKNGEWNHKCCECQALEENKDFDVLE